MVNERMYQTNTMYCLIENYADKERRRIICVSSNKDLVFTKLREYESIHRFCRVEDREGNVLS